MINGWLCPIFQERLEEELFSPEKAAPDHLRDVVSFAPYFISFEGEGLVVKCSPFRLSNSCTFDILWREALGRTAHCRAGLDSLHPFVYSQAPRLQ